jgi:hypothetical protein
MVTVARNLAGGALTLAALALFLSTIAIWSAIICGA